MNWIAYTYVFGLGGLLMFVALMWWMSWETPKWYEVALPLLVAVTWPVGIPVAWAAIALTVAKEKRVFRKWSEQWDKDHAAPTRSGA